MPTVVAAAAVWGPWAALLAGAFTLLPGAAYLFPTTYTLSPDGVRLDNPFVHTRRPWSAFSGQRTFTDAIELQFDRRLPRGWVLRSVLLYFGDGDREAVVRTVRQALAMHRAAR